MLTAALSRVGELIANGDIAKSGLDEANPIVRFLRDGSLEAYLQLDDFVVWGSIASMSVGGDPILSEVSGRLLRRELFKVVNVGARLGQRGGDAAEARFRLRLSEARKANAFGDFDVFEDGPTRSPYKRRGHDSSGALEKVLIRMPHGNNYEDLSDRSEVVKSLSERSLYRVYVRDEKTKEAIEAMVEEIGS